MQSERRSADLDNVFVETFSNIEKQIAALDERVKLLENQPSQESIANRRLTPKRKPKIKLKSKFNKQRDALQRKYNAETIALEGPVA